ncbi:MAG: molybdate ABC transporter substrate-binding protein [Oscillospiraceae bacterium]|nr:molybdate ABC transporter substrate-binding protein [Oscillospiraceae bacterium]
MKKWIALLLALAMLGCLFAGCGKTDDPGSTLDATQADTPGSDVPDETTNAEPVELIIFAAASMTETLNQVAELYRDVAPNVTLTFNFDSSGTLKTQIQSGADCDIFISAGQKQMNELDISADPSINTEGLDFVLEGSRFDILENKVTLCVPDGVENGVTSFDDMAQKLKDGSILLAMGNEDVPVGQYTQKILAYYELDEAALAAAGHITYGSNVKEVTTQISEGTVDCGVIYCTDAYSAGLTVVDSATADMCGQVIYPAAVLNTSKHQEAAQAFLEYLKTPEVSAIFEGVGFTALQ